jgi:hypothetical protein
MRTYMESQALPNDAARGVDVHLVICRDDEGPRLVIMDAAKRVIMDVPVPYDTAMAAGYAFDKSARHTMDAHERTVRVERLTGDTQARPPEWQPESVPRPVAAVPAGSFAPSYTGPEDLAPQPRGPRWLRGRGQPDHIHADHTRALPVVDGRRDVG